MRAMPALLAALLGCAPDRMVTGVTPEQGKVETKNVPAVPNKNVDILFVIDDSGSMKEEQESLKANFPRFIEILETIDGGLPDVQIGVITPNLGTTALDGSKAPSLGSCLDTGGERGELRPLGAGGPRFLRDVAKPGGRETNYGALTLAQAFAQIASVGSTGCGIEQHLEAMKRALENPTNAGFVRASAYLAVVVIADEDDCSLAKSSLFDGNRSDPTYSDTVNFRCTSHGVECDSPATPFDEVIGRRDGCHPKQNSELIASIDRYVEFLAAKKPDKRDILVAGIIGDPKPFDIVHKPNTMTKVLGRSCTYTGPMGEQFAFPGVRHADFLSRFPNTARATICNADLSDGLAEIAEKLRKIVVDECFEYNLGDADPETPGAQYDCSVVEVRRRPDGVDEELRVLPACGDGRTPCWRVEEDEAQCSYTETDPHLKLVIDRAGEVPAADIWVRASCVTGNSSGPLR